MTSSKRHHRLLNNQQFREVYNRGRKFDCPFFSAFFLKAEAGDQRLGVTVTRKLGGAVVRNRCKRRLREVFRLRDRAIVADIGYDLVINAKSALIQARFEQVQDAFHQQLTRFRTHVEREEARRREVAVEAGER